MVEMVVLGVEMVTGWRRVSVGDGRGGSEVVAWWQRLCGSHDDGGVVEMRMCGGSVVGGGVGWHRGGWWCRRLVAEKWLEKG
ncbi:hypothetical protein Tco_1308445 [Tanacetum coccineum]